MTTRNDALVLLTRLANEGVEGTETYGKGHSGVGGPGEWGISLWSPSGRVWATTGTHGLEVSADKAAEFWALLLDDLEPGLDTCAQPDCEGCG